MNKNKKVCGVDEAGRGSLIGPMVLAGVLFNKSTKATFRRLGVKDSKLLSKKRREELYKKIIDKVEYKIILISPKAIDKAVTISGDATKACVFGLPSALLAKFLLKE